MRCGTLVGAGLALLASTPAAAQTEDDARTGGNLAAVTIDDGFLLYNRREACDERTNVDVDVQFRPDSIPLIDSTLFIWWETGDCVGRVPDGVLAEEAISLTSGDHPLLSGSYDFPEDSDVDEFTEVSILDSFGETDPCGSSGVTSEQSRLCFGVVPNDVGGGAEPSLASTHVYGWVLFELDSAVPPIPNAPSVTELDQALELGTSIAGTGETDDIVKWHVLYREAPLQPDGGPSGGDTDASAGDTDARSGDDDTTGGDADSPSDCGEWPVSQETTLNTPGEDITLQVAGLKNGTEYELCVFAEDDAGNTGLKSPTVRGTPRDECDFIECYPGTLKTGYCASVGTVPLGLLALAAPLALRRRARLKR